MSIVPRRFVPSLGMIGVALVALVATVPVGAQEVAPLIRQENRATSGVKNRPAPAPDGQVMPGAAATPTPQPTPNPELVYVAIVNNHTMSRATLDRMVAGRIRDPQSASMLGVTPAATARVDAPAKVVDPEDLMVAYAGEMEVQSARRKEEAEIVRGWVEQTTLADEARRQGLLINEAELSQRLAGITAEFELGDDSVDRMLAAMGMTRNELEASIYDALLIERLLDRWIETNMTDEQFRAAYRASPQLYVTPPSYRVAHFSISLPDATVLSTNAASRRDYLRSVRREASDVRARLAKGEDPETVFTEVSERDMGVWGTVASTSLQADALPPMVRAEILKLKPGQTSNVFESLVMDSNNKPVPESVHVVKLIDLIPAKGLTFDSALPRMRLLARELARTSLLEQIAEAKTHTRVTNLSGIPPHKLPDAIAMRTTKPGIALRRQTPITIDNRTP